MAAVSGVLVERASSSSLSYDYSPAFLLMAICWSLDLVVVWGLKVPETKGEDNSNPWADVGALLH